MNKRAKSNSIRVISGQFKGRKIEVLNASGLRPTTDRARETLFNWLMYDVQGARCLDLFAGTGALGIECLSRGAAFVQFVEFNKLAFSHINRSLVDFGVDQGKCSVLNLSFDVFLARPPVQPYDVVFLDPPFDSDFLSAAVRILANTGWLSREAVVCIEQSAQIPMLEVPRHWAVHRERKIGQSLLTVYALNNA